MVRLFLVLFCSVFLLFSCSKKSDNIEPDLGTQVSGTYNITYAEYDGVGVKLPAAGVSMTVIIERTNENTAEVELRTNNNGAITKGGGTVNLSKSGSKIEMYEVGGSLGYVEGNTVHIEGITDGMEFSAIGSK